MGEVRADVTLENGDDLAFVRRGALEPAAVRKLKAKLLVDTGAVLVLLPQDMVEALGVATFDRVIVTLANEQKIELAKAGPFHLTVAGRSMAIDCLVGPPQCEPLLGQVVLETLDLIVDPVRQTLTPRPESPFLPSLKMKTLAPAV